MILITQNCELDQNIMSLKTTPYNRLVCACMYMSACECFACMHVNVSCILWILQVDQTKIEELRRNVNFSKVFKVVLSDAMKDETVEQQRGMQHDLSTTHP